MDELIVYLNSLPICKRAYASEYSLGIQLMFISKKELDSLDVQFLEDISFLSEYPLVLIEPLEQLGSFRIRRMRNGSF